MDATADETQPLLLRFKSNTESTESGGVPIAGHHHQAYNTGSCDSAEFDPLGDLDNPLEWPTPFKWGIVTLLAIIAFTVCVPIIINFPFLFFSPIFLFLSRHLNPVPPRIGIGSGPERHPTVRSGPDQPKLPVPMDVMQCNVMRRHDELTGILVVEHLPASGWFPLRQTSGESCRVRLAVACVERAARDHLGARGGGGTAADRAAF